MAQRGDISQQEAAGQEENVDLTSQVLTHFCQPCSNNSKETTADVFCLTCKEFQCQDCSNGHKTYSFMKNHKLFDASAAPEMTIAYDMNGLDRCGKHDKLVKFFCMDDRKLCCSTCAIIEHRKCFCVDEIKKNIASDQSDINTLKVNINNLKQRSEAAVRYSIHSEKNLQEQVKNLFEHL
ncbi:tripartite motif-containing protein 66-like [Mercenaria mercenaria]|uniref:tripartite motif-containing protein 66-like n=1 Tax=Mercenaria mercenaria TaxID=6596 RepID=UPI00234E4626|nr:tripartite motif-containing protein 66-like [Mercenaria mercenaria]